MAAKKLARHLGHLRAATGYSLQGLAQAARSETAFQQEILALALLPAAAWLYGLPGRAVVLVLAAWLIVMALELLNVAVEAVCNLVSPDFHPLVKIAKDAASAAVLLAISANALFWVYLVFSYW